MQRPEGWASLRHQQVAGMLEWSETGEVDGDEIREEHRGQVTGRIQILSDHSQSWYGSKPGFQNVIPGPAASA